MPKSLLSDINFTVLDKKRHPEHTLKRLPNNNMSSDSETKFDDENILKKRYSRLNAIINRRFLERHYNKRDDQIVFYNFIQNLIRRYVERRV